jgi:hypothetical protein
MPWTVIKGGIFDFCVSEIINKARFSSEGSLTISYLQRNKI